MTTPHEHEFDPDDNFAMPGDAGTEIDDEASVDALVWQLLLLINPGDEDAALQQFAGFQDALDGGDAADIDAVWLLKDVIDWKSGFHVDEREPGTLVDSINELAARYGLRLDWGIDDAIDTAEVDGVQMTDLLDTAFDQLRLDGYTLWTWETGTDAVAGWMTRSGDDEGMRVIASELAIDARPAGT